MSKLIYFEFKKLLKNSFLLSMTILFLLLNLISIHYQQIQKFDDPIYYSKMYDIKLNEIKNEDDFYATIESKLRSNEDETINIILNNILNEKKSIDSFQEKINSIIIQSENMSGISIFNDNKGSLSNIIKTAADYNKIQNVDLKLNNHLGLQAFLDMNYTDLFILILLIMSLGILIVNENNSGMNTLIKSTILGDKQTLFAKWIVILTVTIIFNLLFYGINLAYSNFIFGLTNLSDSIQSCKEFMDFTLPLNGIQMILYTLGYRILVSFSFAFIIFVLLYLLKNSILVSGICLTFVAIEAILYNIIPLQSNLSIFRYINIFSIFNINFSLYKYNNMILFDHAFSMKEIIPILSILMIMINMFLLSIINPIEIDNSNKIMENIRSKIKFTNHCSLFIHELYKSLIHNKGIIVMMLLIGYFGISIDSYERSSVDTPYQLIIQEYGGELSNEKTNEIAELKQQIENTQYELYELETKMNNGEISVEEFYKKYNETRDLMILSTGINQLEEQLLFVNGNNLGIVDVPGYERLFDVGINNSRLNGVMINFIVLILGLILCIAPIATIDKNRDIYRLYVVNCTNERTIKLSKQMVTLFYVFVINLIFNLWKYVSIAKYYILEGGQFNIGSVPSLIGVFHQDMSLFEAYNCMFIIRFLVLLLCAEIVLYFSNRNESIFATIVKSIGVLILPIILMYIGFNNIESILPSYYFTSIYAYELILFSIEKLIFIVTATVILLVFFIYSN